ncbi:hypothetical protein D3C71_1591550 [compost metagenome]
MGWSSVSSTRTSDAGNSASWMRSSRNCTERSSESVVAGALIARGTATPARRKVSSASMTLTQTRSKRVLSSPSRLTAGMNSAGMTNPKRGCCHRAKASADTILPVRRSTCGCSITRKPSLPMIMAAISASLTTGPGSSMFGVMSMLLGRLLVRPALSGRRRDTVDMSVRSHCSVKAIDWV